MVNLWQKRIRLAATVTVTATVTIVALYVIVRGDYPDATAKWAFGAVGMVLGYWLR